MTDRIRVPIGHRLFYTAKAIVGVLVLGAVDPKPRRTPAPRARHRRIPAHVGHPAAEQPGASS